MIGCALTPPQVDVGYHPGAPAAKVADSSMPHVSVEVVDNRKTREVGETIATFGIKTADTVTRADVPATLKSAFESELKNRGFIESVDGNTLIVRLGYFRNVFVQRSFVFEASASMDLEVSIVSAGGAIPYRKYVTGSAHRTFAVASGGNEQLMLEAALRDAVSKVFNDPQFLVALEKS